MIEAIKNYREELVAAAIRLNVQKQSEVASAMEDEKARLEDDSLEVVVFPITLIIHLIVVFPPIAHLFDCCMFIDSSILIDPIIFLAWNGLIVLAVGCECK